MKTALFAAILLVAISVPAAYASTLQLVTENGNVFSIDYDEILAIWDLYHGNSTAQTALNGTVLQEIDNLQMQIDDLIAKLNSNSTDTEINKLEERVDDLLTQLNSNSTSTETEIERLGDLIANLTSNSDVAIDRLEQLIANLDNATESEIIELNELLDKLETDLLTQIDELEAGTGVGAGALGSSGRLTSLPIDGALVPGVHTVRDTRGTIYPLAAYFYPDYNFDWVALIRDNEVYDEYEVSKFGTEYNANTGAGILTETSTTQASELIVRGLNPNTAWALVLNGTDDLSYAGVTNSAGEVLIPRTANDGVTVTRTTPSFDRSPDLRIPEQGTVYDTITVSEYGTVNDLHVTITSSTGAYLSQLVSPDGTVYQVVSSGDGASGSKTYVVSAVGEQINGDWTLTFTSISGFSTLQNWTLAINHGSTGKVQSISSSGSPYTVTVGQTYYGSFGLDLANIHGITDASGNLLDNSLQTGPDEIHNDVGGIVCSGGDFHVCAIERNNPATEQVSTSSVEYLVTFNEDATNVDASDFVSLRSIVTVSPKIQNTAFDVWHKDEQTLPSTSRISVNSINTITSAKLMLDVSGHDFTEDWDLILTVPGGTVIKIAGDGQPALNNANGLYGFYLGEMIGIDPSNGYWVLSAIDNSSHDDDPTGIDSDTTTPATVEDPEGQINSWSLEFDHGTTYRGGNIGTVRQDGTNDDKYIVPVTGLYNNYNGYTLWLKGDNDIEQTSGGNMIDPREEFAPDPHESYNMGSVSIPSTPHVRGITVSGSTSNSVTFQVMFSETVTGVNATDFIVIQNGSPESSGPQESTYSSTPDIAVYDGTTVTVSDTITVSGYDAGSVESLTVDVDITSTNLKYVEIKLVGPDGTTHEIYRNYTHNVVNLTASFTPDFAGQEVNGNWTLQARDYSRNEQSYGTINSWSLDFAYADTPTYEELLDIAADQGTAHAWRDFLPGNYHLRIYPDASVHTTSCVTGAVMIDAYNKATLCIPNNNDRDFIYTASAYMKYPITVAVGISQVKMINPGESQTVSLSYINGRYLEGESFYIPVIPGMPKLSIQINGVDAVVFLADIADPVKIASISSSSGNPALSNVSFFATTDGAYTVHLQASTYTDMNIRKSFNFANQINHLRTSTSDYSYTGGYAETRAGAGAYGNQQLLNHARSNWSSLVQQNGFQSTASGAIVTYEIYRNGLLVATESDQSGFTPVVNIQSSSLWSGSGTVYQPGTVFDVSKTFTFDTEAGDYIEIVISLKTSVSATNPSFTSMLGKAWVCYNGSTSRVMFQEDGPPYEFSGGCRTTSFYGPYGDPNTNASLIVRASLTGNQPDPIYSSTSDITTEIRGGYMIIVN